MDGSILSNSIYSLKGIDLRIIYSLLMSMDLKKMVSFNINRLLAREHNKDYVNFIFETANEYKNIPDEMMQVRLFQEINKVLGLNSVYYEEPCQIEQQCEQMVNKVYQLYTHQEKMFRNYTVEHIEFTKIHHLIHYQLAYFYDEFEECFQNLSANDQSEMIGTIYHAIFLLPENQKRFIQERLPVLIISKEDIHEVKLSALLSVLANVNLPSFIQMITELLPQYMDRLEINFPFMNENQLSPATRLLTSPYFITPNLLGGRPLQINYQLSMKKRMLPYILMQITMNYLCQEESRPSHVLFLEEWKRMVVHYRQLEYEATVFEMKHIEWSEKIHNSRKKIQEYEQQKTKILERVQIEIHKLKSTLSFMDLNELTINESFEKHRSEFYSTRMKLDQLTLSKREEILETSFIKQVTMKLLNMSATLDQFAEEKKANQLLESLVLDIVNSDSDFKRSERIIIKRLQNEIEEINFLIKQEFGVIEEYKKELAKLNQQAKENSQKLKQIETENYGVKEVVREMNFI